MNLIVAVDSNWAIGKENKLLVSIPQDMKFFRETTKGKVVAMGRKTLESFPGGQPLKNRVNVVLTTDKNDRTFCRRDGRRIKKIQFGRCLCDRWREYLPPTSSVLYKGLCYKDRSCI